MKKIIALLFAIIVPVVAVINPTIDGKTSLQYGARAVLSISVTNATSDWILIPENTEMTTVSLALASNSARVEYTTVPYPLLTNTTHIFVWPLGTVTNASIDALLADAIALRVVAQTNVTHAYFVFKRKIQ